MHQSNSALRPAVKNCFLIYLTFLLLLAAPAVRAQSTTNDDDARARLLVSEMTLQEKITELHGIHDADHQRYVPPIPRLGIPGFRIANGPAGMGPGDEHQQLPATALPAPISLAASWDAGLAREYGAVIGLEARDMDDDLLEGPDVNIARVPQNGRTFEAFGEDPYLVAQLAVAEIQGIQSEGEIANVKHYAANNQETQRFTINEIVGERALREIYLPAFKASVQQGNVASVMSAYPRVNGEYCCQNDELENEILKKEWGFKGFVTSDFGAVHSTVPSAMAGLDLEMPTGKYFGDALESAVQSGQVPMSVIDDKLIRRFRTMMQYGLFDNPPRRQLVPEALDGQISRRIAEAGMVLLKNDANELPLHADGLKRIAVIGPYAAKAMTGGGGSSHVLPLYTVDPVEGIALRLGAAVKGNFVDARGNVTWHGYTWGPDQNNAVIFDDGKDIDRAASLAKSADVAIVMVGDNEVEGKDHSISLGGNQDELVHAVAAANPHTIVVLKTGSAVLMPWVDEVPAILEAWYPGEEDGNAVAAVLFGDVNPSGKLPLTFPRQLADLPANTPAQYPGVNGVVDYSEGIFVGYRHYDEKGIQPLFPFGYGLSYTHFSYKNLAVSPGKITVNNVSSPQVTVDLEVRNSGERAGVEVVQLYVGMPSTRAIPQPPLQLKRFEKVALQAGDTTHVQFLLDGQSLSCWDTKRHAWTIQPGTYRIMVGSSSRDIRLEGEFRVHGHSLFHWLGL